MFQKKALLDRAVDEYESYRAEFRTVQLEWDRVKSEKQRMENELKLLQSKLQKEKESNEERRRIMERGHELSMRELLARHQSELSKLENEYSLKIERAKHEKVKEFEVQRNKLLDQVEDKRNKIRMNDSILADMKQELEDKYNTKKEEWLKQYQEDWKEQLRKNEEVTTEIGELEAKLDKELYPELSALEERVAKLRTTLGTLRATVEQQDAEARDINDKIASKTAQIEKSENTMHNLLQKIDEIGPNLKAVNDQLMREETMRRTLHNQLQELRGNIRVYCRVRPPLPSTEDSDTSHIKVNKFDDTEGTQTIEVTKCGSTVSNIMGNKEILSYKFDKIFDQNETNRDVFNEVCQLVQSALDGYNVCIFAYGQTGSGKTYTMLNPKDGVIPMTIAHIFDWTNNLRERGWEYKISCQFVEIYNETIIDLLRSDTDKTHASGEQVPAANSKHEIRHNPEMGTTSITNISECVLDCENTVSKVLQRASKLRSTASTRLNEHSSRSHSIFIIHLNGHNVRTNETSNGTLNLIDLAGSERVAVSRVTGDRLNETKYINKSLSSLGDVIHALNNDSGTGTRHIPFRNSKLTYLLQYSLIGDSKTLMFVNISPNKEHINETLNSLRFAAKVNSTKMAK